MTSEHLEDDVGTPRRCHTFGSLALTSTKVRNMKSPMAHCGSLWRIGLHFYEFSLFQVDIQLPTEKRCRLRGEFSAMRSDAHGCQCWLLKAYPAGKCTTRAVGPLSQFLFGNEFVLKHNFTYRLSLFTSYQPDTPVVFTSYARRNDDFSFLTVHVYTRALENIWRIWLIWRVRLVWRCIRLASLDHGIVGQ